MRLHRFRRAPAYPGNAGEFTYVGAFNLVDALICYTALMPLLLDNPELEHLAKRVAEQTGQQLEQAVLDALQEKLARLTSASEQLSLAADLLRKDYEHDKELTAFTALDSEPFYEEG